MIALHDIADASSFRDKMTWLREQYDVVSMDRFLNEEISRKPEESQRTQVAITFDDGFESWHEIAAPILDDLELPAVFFICSGFVGLQGSEAHDFSRRHLRRHSQLKPLTNDQLLDLSGNPRFEIGSHTVNHVNLNRQFPPGRLSSEIDADRAKLEDWTGNPVRLFAYPFGGPTNISYQSIDFVRKSGFTAAFSFIPGYWDPQRGRHTIGRDGLDIKAPTWLWHAWLNGSYDALYKVKSKLIK
ncbi:polysaccharide deacetylase family protein [Dehalococcoidia bacterium]|nr:polysaccharide deacetylase family protein [Dehalococcoidia bacterium]